VTEAANNAPQCAAHGAVNWSNVGELRANLDQQTREFFSGILVCALCRIAQLELLQKRENITRRERRSGPCPTDAAQEPLPARRSWESRYALGPNVCHSDHRGELRRWRHHCLH
jgi:hypothetical protein